MKTKICIPVMGNTLTELLANMKKSQTQSDCIEIRADSVENLELSDVEQIRAAITGEAIFTCRSSEEGGIHPYKDNIRHQLLQKALDLKFHYVDIELKTIEAREFTRNSTSKIIVSYHNFLETPTYWDLTKKIDDMRSYRADIMKIATMVQADKDIITLTRVLVNKLPNDEVIILGMGDKGKITRVLQLALGGYLTYASADSGASAPGQMNITALKKSLEVISSLT